jgi:ElaB/YqjD/DUF883 family membrane-anchored ribosome-binding protein
MDKVEKAPTGIEARERLAQDMRTLVRDAEDLLHAAQRQGLEGVTDMRERLENSIKQAKAQIWNGQHQLFDRARDTARRTNDAVHVHPWTAVGMAAGAGLLLGALIMRR